MLVRDPREISDHLVSALVDFCRRAERPTTPGEARIALARLGSDRDREVLRLASMEPPARPLSPHAFVDWVQGMPPEQAAALENAGAYQAIAREAALRAIDLQVELDRAAKTEKAVRTAPRRPRRTRPSSIDPIVRRRPRPEAGAEASAERPTTADETAEGVPARPGRRPAKPTFGRFVSGTPVRRPAEELENPSGEAILRELLAETHGNPTLLLERLNALWEGPFDRKRLEKLLERHGLAEARRTAERERLRALFRRHRGFDRPVARAWQVSIPELRRLVDQYGLSTEVAELARRAREEILAEPRLDTRLDLLFREADRLRALRAYRELRDQLRADLLARVENAPVETQAETPEALLEIVRREAEIDRATWRRAVDAFGLLGAAARRLGVPFSPSREDDDRPRRFGRPRSWRDRTGRSR
ncbi:MAG: hypothetical protein DIU72_001540 [Pseudomonadota bacterium]